MNCNHGCVDDEVAAVNPSSRGRCEPRHQPMRAETGPRSQYIMPAHFTAGPVRVQLRLLVLVSTS